MLDYVFFHEQPFAIFVAYLKGLELTPETKCDDEVFEVSLPDDLNDDLAEKIEIEYDRLLDLNRDMVFAQGQAEGRNYRMASLVLQLKDGKTSQVDVEPEIISKVLEVLTLKEWSALVASIVSGVEDPDERLFCQRVRAGDVDLK